MNQDITTKQLWTAIVNRDAEINKLVKKAKFQERCAAWAATCFGRDWYKNVLGRNFRFLEEALELVQSLGCTKKEALALVDYVYGRPVGEPKQEVGGTRVTLALLCTANNINLADAGEVELARVLTKLEEIRAKDAAKPFHSPLPGPSVNS
jgi:hypothetical protein